MVSQNGKRDIKTSTTIHVLLANMPVVLAEYIDHILRQHPNMHCKGHIEGNVELLLSMTQDVDVLLLAADDLYPPPGICSHLLQEFPHLKIIVLNPTGGQGVLYWLGLRHRQVRSISSEKLLITIQQLYTLEHE